MEPSGVYVGLDYHRQSVQVCVVDRGGAVLVNRRCENSVAGVAGAAPSGCRVLGVAIESCCGAADLAESLRDEAGWPVTLAHPGFVSRMRHNPDKSDYSDARMLAELSRAGFIPPVWLAPPWVRELRLLVRLRADLVARARAVKTRILGVLRAQRVAEPETSRRWTRRWHEWLRGTGACSDAARFVIAMHLEELGTLRAQIGSVEAKLAELTREDPIVARLLAEPGVGPVTAWTMRALIGVFERFGSGKQLARFCAVTPRNASSGQRVADAGLIRAGDPLLKTVVIEAAHRLRRHEPRWAALSARLAEQGKPTSVIVAAVANRWMRWMYHQIKELPTAA
jgi:transposase